MENPHLYSKETEGLATPPLLIGYLAHEKGKRENERKTEASYESFPKSTLLNVELNVYLSFL